MNQLTKKLSAVLQTSLPKKATSVSYAIMKDGVLLAADALGHQGDKDKTPATINCTYNVASVSKIYCTVAVMQLVEQGKVDLDTPIVQYLPRFSMPMDQRHKQITLRHCLSHTSGLPGTQWRGFSVSDVKNCNYYDDVYDYLSKSTLKADPGEYAVYCNDGFTMAEMVVAEVSGIPFDIYCKEYITDPIGAESTRLSALHHENHPLVREYKKPAELLLIQGGAGFTTSMVDLCKFGQLFLTSNAIISEESKKEMAKPQGHTFLPSDDRTELYGLGWDNVAFMEPDFDLGEGVLLKGGNSFQFTTQFIVLPKYNAVLAMSETHDCDLDVNGTLLRLFALALLETEGKNIYTHSQPVPAEIVEKYSGIYLMPSHVVKLDIDGACADASFLHVRGGKDRFYKDLRWNGTRFEGEKGQTFFFEEKGGDTFLMTTLKGRTSASCMKAKEFENTPKAWEDRLGKDYIVINTTANDYIIYEIMTGFRVIKTPECKGLYTLSFSGRSDSGVYGLFEGTVSAVDDNIGRGFLRTPTNGSRDLIDPIFSVENGIEYCEVASYRYQEVSTLPAYAGQGFNDGYRNNGVYTIKEELKELPAIPEGRRIMVMDKDMITVYDSLFSEEYKPVKEGYISLI